MSSRATITIYEPYQNLALRTVEGTDIAIYYDFETSIGDFSVTLQSSITDKFEQEPSAQFSAIAAAVADGTLPPYISLEGYGDLKKMRILERSERYFKS